jgi:hypothetical protein
MQQATLQISNLARFVESALQAFEICVAVHLIGNNSHLCPTLAAWRRRLSHALPRKADSAS